MRLPDLRLPSAASSAAVAIAVVSPLLALGLYALVVGPDALHPTPSAASDPATATTHAAPLRREDLAAHLARDPRDGRSWVLLARIDFAADRFADAATAYGRALDVSTKVARDPAVWCEYADALGMAQGGSLAGRPRELIGHALVLDPAHPAALEMAGSAAYEQGEFAAAAAYWRQLLARMPADKAARGELETAIASADARIALPRGR